MFYSYFTSNPSTSTNATTTTTTTKTNSNTDDDINKNYECNNQYIDKIDDNNNNSIIKSKNNNPKHTCQSCRKESRQFLAQQNENNDKLNVVVAKCIDCDCYLCSMCYTAHRNMEFLKSHQIVQVMNDDYLNEGADWSNGENKYDDEDIDSISSGSNSNINNDEYTLSGLNHHKYDDMFHSKMSSDETESIISDTNSEKSSNNKIMLNNLDDFSNSSENENETKLDSILSNMDTIKYLLKLKQKINDTYQFYQKSLVKKRDNLIDELNKIFLAQTLSHNNVENIEFLSDYLTIQSSINNSFGFFNLNIPPGLDITQNFNYGLADELDKTITTPPSSTFVTLKQTELNNNSHGTLMPNFSSNGSGSISSSSTQQLSPFSLSESYSSPDKQNSEYYDINMKNNDLESCLNSIYPKFKIYRLKMQLRFKFGGMGLDDNKFTEPNGVTFNSNNDIIVADSNSNLIKIFDSNGYFKFKFGQNKLLFPNRVACHKPTGDIVIIERKPAHEIKIFNQNGCLIRRFGAGLLKSPRGIYIDRNSRIIILESKVMRVLIFDMKGILLKFFDVSQQFRFANSVCTSNIKDEIFISDNHSHCIKVFDYEGKFLRELGGRGLTNYPTSVDINKNGELLVTDNYNSFNLTVLTQDGELVNAYESKMKHSRILDVAIMNNDSVIFSSRDNNIYMYNYTNTF